MKKTSILLLLLLLCLPLSAQVRLSDLKTNHMTAPSGVVDSHPVFSWIMSSDSRNVTQSAYQVRVFEKGRLIWDSSKVPSDNSVNVPYQGPELSSGTVYTWNVRVWDNKGKASKAVSSSFMTGMRDGSAWKARWIEPQDQNRNVFLLRKDFTLEKNVLSATLYVTSHGVYEASINASKISQDRMTPGWTSYDKRLQYQTYDVTGNLKKGANALGVELAPGWYLSRLGFTSGEHQIYELDKMGLLLQLEVTFTDGSKKLVVTDGSWKSAPSERTHSIIYDGETVDNRLKRNGWNAPGYNDSDWKDVQEADYSFSNLVSQSGVAVRIQQYVDPVEVITTPKGEKVIDFGQNLVGTEIMRLKGRPGQKITISHAEVLDENGNFYTTNLRSATARSEYICSGQDEEFQTKFTFYGFRYIKVEGWEGDLDPGAFKAAVIFSDLEQTGSFTSSNAQVNQLESNISWGLKGNFLDVPTDCPQRDERLGWTGDAEVFSRTATFLRDVQAFYGKWLLDLSADQMEDGAVTDIVPFINGLVGSGHTGWGDAAVVIPWNVYMAYGDFGILSRQYDSMRKWADFMVSQSRDDLWNVGWHYGDWLFYSEDNDNGGNSAVTYKPLIQQCFFANALDIVARSARILGYEADVRRYEDLASRARAAFQRSYVTQDGHLVSHTQTAYVLALNFDMMPEHLRSNAAAYLAENVHAYGHITTGFLGTPFITHVLTRFGYNDVAYELLLHQGYPGWLYPVSMGATTIWERWNSMMPDHTIPDNGMNSFNHYSYGAIGDWLYRDAAGLQEASPGYKTIRIQPHEGGGFTSMGASHKTPYGTASVDWKRQDDLFLMDVTVPVNTTASVCVPLGKEGTVLLDGLRQDDFETRDGYAVIKVGSGTYHFQSR